MINHNELREREPIEYCFSCQPHTNQNQSDRHVSIHELTPTSDSITMDCINNATKQMINSALETNDVFELYKFLSNEIEMELKQNTKTIKDLSERYIFGDEYIQFTDHPWNNRKLLIILNPHGGNKKAKQIFDIIVSPLFNKVHLSYDVMETKYSNHAEEMGTNYDYNKYEGVIFISGDGTVNEFLNGILSRSHARNILRNTLFGVIPAGSENCLARGIGTNSIYSSLYCILKRETRLFDSICVSNSNMEVRYSFAGCAWGIVSDMVQDYENFRCFGRARYWYLKGIHGCFCRRTHHCILRYKLSNNQIRRQCNEHYPNCQDCKNSSLHPLNIIPRLPLSSLGVITTDIYEMSSPKLNTPYQLAFSELNKDKICIDIDKSVPLSPDSEHIPIHFHPLIKFRNKLFGWDKKYEDGMKQQVQDSSTITTKSPEAYELQSIHDPSLALSAPSSTPPKLLKKLNMDKISHHTSLELSVIPEIQSEEETSVDKRKFSETNIIKHPVNEINSTKYQINTDKQSLQQDIKNSETHIHEEQNSIQNDTKKIDDVTIPLNSQDLEDIKDRELSIKSLLKLYPPGWIEEEGAFHTLGIVNTSPDAIFSHATSSCIDLAIARKGTCIDDTLLALKYVVGNEFSSEQIDYFKVYAVEIESDTDPLIMLDGEIFRGPSPIHFTCIPSLLTVYGEY